MIFKGENKLEIMDTNVADFVVKLKQIKFAS